MSANDSTVDFSIGTELRFAVILLIAECSIFWSVVYCIRRKKSKVSNMTIGEALEMYQQQ